MKSITLIIFLITPGWLLAQSSTTEALHKKHADALSLFFYNNTLRMLNQSEDKDFDAIIKDIEKMKFLMIKKDETNFSGIDFKKLVSDYKSESFDGIMTSRHEGKNFDVFLRENGGKTKGMLVLINDSTNLYILDIQGRIALDKIAKLYSTLDKSADIGRKIKAFTGDDQKKDDEKKSEKNH